MAILSSLFCSCLAAISLGGVSGGKISAEASLTAHNVHVGDPIDLMVDFVGEADFTSLHPPSLSGAVLYPLGHYHHLVHVSCRV